MRHALIALLVGPAGYVVAGRKHRALVSAGISCCLMLLVAYLPYVQVFSELNWGGDSPRELFDTTVAATQAWLAMAPTWAPWVLVALALVNVVCALDLAIASRRPRPPSP